MPEGTFRGSTPEGTYVVTRTQAAGGKAWSLVAEGLGGRDYISLNLYRTTRGPILKPCEMPTEKVVAFVLGLQPDQ